MTRILPFLRQDYRIMQDCFPARLLILCLLLILSQSQAQLPMPPTVTRSTVIAPKLRHYTIRWNESPNAAGYIGGVRTAENIYEEIEFQVGRTNQFSYATTNRNRQLAWLMAVNSNGVGCGQFLEAHFPRYPDLFDHILLTWAEPPPVTIEASDDLQTWKEFAIVEAQSLAVWPTSPRMLFRAFAEYEVTLTATAVLKPDPREL